MLEKLGDPKWDRRPIPPNSPDELCALMAFSPGLRGPEDRRWKILYQAAVWCIWKDFLSHSFASTYRLWHPDTARNNYRDVIRQQVLGDRAACLIERYQNKDTNPDEFFGRWGQLPLAMSITKGPAFLTREVPVYDLDEDDGDEDWVTETED